MSLIEIQGFDHQLSITDLVANVSTPNAMWEWNLCSLSPPLFVAGKFGGKALSLGSSGFFSGTNTSTFVDDTIILGCYLSVPATGNVIIGFWNSAIQTPPSSIQSCVVLDGITGIISIYRGYTSGTLLYASSGDQFGRGSWFYFEIKIKIHSSLGTVDIQLDGIPYLTLTELDNQGGSSSSVDSLFFSGGGKVDHIYIEDIAVGPGANPYNDFIGIQRVFTRFATANGIVTDFTPLSGENYTQVDEVAMDSDTTYNYDSAVIGDKDLFEASPLPNFKSTAPPLFACKIKGTYREEGSLLLRGMANKLRSGTTEFTGSTVEITSLYKYQGDIYPQNPDGDVEWTPASINTSQIGYEIVEFKRMSIDGTVGLSTAVDKLEAGTSDKSVTLVTALTDDVVIVHVVMNAENNVLQPDASITDNIGLTWARRHRTGGTIVDGYAHGDTTVDTQTWWAIKPVPGPIIITVHTVSDLAFLRISAYGINGANTTSPWDTNVSLPAVGTNLSNTPAAVEVLGVSTDDPDCMLLYEYDTYGTVNLLGIPTGFTAIIGGLCISAAVQLLINEKSYANIVSTTLSSETIVVDPVVLPGSVHVLSRWISTVDAIRAA